MHLILQHQEPDDFVIASGETHSVRQFCEIVFRKLGLDYRQYVVQSPRFMRPEELNYLCGDSSKAKATLGWKPEYSLDRLIDEMIEAFQTSLRAGAVQ
jgi:GDPmannose 4,6-dehydratase